MLVLPPLIVGFLLCGPALAMVFAALAGAATIATFAVTIVMGQEYLPGRIGVASGVTIGLSIGLGGVGAPLLGLLADAHGLRAVFEVVAVFPLLAWLCRPAAAAAAPGPPRNAPAAAPTAGSRARPTGVTRRARRRGNFSA